MKYVKKQEKKTLDDKIKLKLYDKSSQLVEYTEFLK